jgi:hypothetical protein
MTGMALCGSWGTPGVRLRCYKRLINLSFAISWSIKWQAIEGHSSLPWEQADLKAMRYGCMQKIQKRIKTG